MTTIKRLLLVTILTFYFGETFSQKADSLSVFPNPFASSTNIHFDIVQSDTITLKVFNSLGQTVRVFFQSTILPGGSYNTKFHGDSLEDGFYFVQLKIGSTKTITKKVVKSETTTSIEDNRAVDKILIFPNPTNDNITIPIAGNKTIVVADLNGKILKSFITDQETISLLDIPAGQYIITILTEQNEKLPPQIILKLE